jgi:hypothetical protein
VRFWWPGPPRVADSPKTSQRLLKRALSHFAYDESPAVRTRICCVVGGRPDSPKDLRGPLAAILRREGPRLKGSHVVVDHWRTAN